MAYGLHKSAEGKCLWRMDYIRVRRVSTKSLELRWRMDCIRVRRVSLKLERVDGLCWLWIG